MTEPDNLLSVITDHWVTTPPFAVGQWVAHAEGPRPTFGRVKAIHEPMDEDGWLMDVVVYDHEGKKIGRRSDPQGGPTTYEPCVPCKHYTGIKQPKSWPLRLNLYGCWRKSLGLPDELPPNAVQ